MPPVIIAAGIGVAATAGSAVIQSSAAKKASNIAAKTAADNNALAKEQYNLNSANLKPYSDRGNTAGGYISDLLGVGGNSDASAKAFDTYRDSTGYKYQLAQGLGAVNSNAYARGMGDSGATLKALQTRGNNVAAGSFNDYLGQLTNVQNTGVNAAASLSGAGQNMVSNVSANNNNAATAAGNAALVSGSAYSNALQSIGNLAGYAYGSSYKAPAAPANAFSSAPGGWV